MVLKLGAVNSVGLRYVLGSKNQRGSQGVVAGNPVEAASVTHGLATGAGAKELAHKIERDISLGRVSPGAWLKQIDLEQTYGVSRLAVRQALERLAERGQVELFPNRGYRVKKFDTQRFDNIIHIRAVLEVAAAEIVADQIDASSFARMHVAAQAFADAVMNGTSTEREQTNRDFHHEMLRTCPNRELVDLIFDLRDRIPLSVQLEKYNTTMLQRSAEEHFQMIELLRGGDRQALARLARRHALGATLELISA